MKLTETHHLTRDEILKPPNWRPSRLRLEILFIRIIQRICDKFQPCRVRHPSRTSLNYCWLCGPSACNCPIRIEWAVAVGQTPQTPGAHCTGHSVLVFRKKNTRVEYKYLKILLKYSNKAFGVSRV